MILKKWAALLLCVGLWMQSEGRLAAHPDDFERRNYVALSTPSKSCWKPLLVKAAVVDFLGVVCFVGAYQGALMALSGETDSHPLVEPLIQIPGDLSQLSFVARTCGWRADASIPASLSDSEVEGKFLELQLTRFYNGTKDLLSLSEQELFKGLYCQCASAPCSIRGSVSGVCEVFWDFQGNIFGKIMRDLRMYNEISEPMQTLKNYCLPFAASWSFRRLLNETLRALPNISTLHLQASITPMTPSTATISSGHDLFDTLGGGGFGG